MNWEKATGRNTEYDMGYKEKLFNRPYNIVDLREKDFLFN